MTREELAGKNKKELTEIAKSFGIKGISKLNRDDLIEHIMLLDPPFSANPELKDEISQHLETTLGVNNPLYTQPPLPEHLTGVAVFDPEQFIPPDYNDTRMILLVRDPYWLYTYWNVNSQTKEQIVYGGRKFEDLPLVIRVYDITDIQFDGTNSNYYFDINLNHYTNNWYINVAKPNRSFCVDLGYIGENGHFKTIVRSNMVTTPRDNVSDVIDEEWMIIEEDFRKIYRLATGTGIGNSSLELVESLIKRLEREMGSGAVSSLSSPIKYQPLQERKFWLVLNTELIVYGATEPDAQVTIQGEPITLRPDGTFTLRFALPDGTQNIPVVAHSADGIDTITITPIVSKQTQS
ncbi:MAG TPA: DUF4912 domain-containing protein [Bacillota bacterium]|nr:DUF4912 domain-containing protein [Bacillota bacterium]